MNNVKILFLSIFLFFTASSFQACVPLLFVGGVTAIGMAAEDQGLGGSLSDKSLKVDIKSSIAGHNIEYYSCIDVNVLEGNVLLTGYLSSQEKIDEIVRIAEETDGVRHVFNELKVGEEQGIGSSTSDAWTAGLIRTEMFLTNDLRSANYLVHITDGVVYLMGVAKNQKELEEVLEIIQDSSGIKEIINMTRFKGQELPPRREKKKEKKLETERSSKNFSKDSIKSTPL